MGFDILERSAYRIRVRSGNHMPLKSFCVFTLSLVFAGSVLAQVTLNNQPSREIGHATLPKPNPFDVATTNPNLVEGREMYLPAALALDTAASPPILYVADTGNHRILAWKNAATFTNGKPADLVIGQKDFYSTAANGPGTAATTGLNSPSGLAVLNGDLYVADTGNNRILRFRAPFNVPAGQQAFPDLCLGQPNFGSAVANAPTGLISEKGLSQPSQIRFDRAGNLWVADGANNRVLRYDAADISRNTSPFGIVAKLEIGQLDFISKQPGLPNTDDARRITNQLSSPTAINFDTAGRLYVGDANSNFSRVLVFQPPFSTGMAAARIMGVTPVPAQGAPAPPDSQIYAVTMSLPTDIFFLPGTQGMGVVDAGFSRILLFDPYDSWPDVSTAFSPSAKTVVGHASGLTGINSRDQKSLVANDGNALGALSSAGTFFLPQAAVFLNNELFVADTFNNRVIVLPYQGGTFQPAYRLLGQDRYDSNAPNLIEGKEFDFIGRVGNQVQVDAGLAVDSTGDTPHLYVSDPYNNRVLGYRDIRSLKAGDAATIVIGQPDFSTNICNYPSGDLAQPLQNNLCRPLGLLVDSAGNLYVADSRNGRVLRFPQPFAHGANQVADLVLGQPSYFVKIPDATASTMGLPYGLAFSNNGLLVSDQLFNRVLFFPFTNGGFTSADNGKPATKVLGQRLFTDFAAGGSDTAMNNPKHISMDTDARLYVVDAGNGRVLIFDSTDRLPAGEAHASVIVPGPSGNISGVFVNQVTGEFWVADLGGSRLVKYPKFDTLQFNPSPTSTSIQSRGPLAVVQDQYGDLVVAEGIHRVTFYFPGLSAVNGANLAPNRFLAPNTWATLYPASGGTFGKETADISSVPNPSPLPKALADVQVLFDGVPAPVYYVSPGQINFLTPWNAATSGQSEVQIQKISTGQILAAGLISMNSVSPGIFMGARISATSVQAAVINQDGTINGPTNPAPRGSVIAIYATGQGFISGAPADGAPASPCLTTPYTPRVFLGVGFTDSVAVQTGEKVPDGGYVTYSGTCVPGLWQVNVQIPMAVDPTAGPAVVFLQVNSFQSNAVNLSGANTVVYVKQ
jgi:uncharacterized protein (TIGR03437 family)